MYTEVLATLVVVAFAYGVYRIATKDRTKGTAVGGSKPQDQKNKD